MELFKKLYQNFSSISSTAELVCKQYLLLKELRPDANDKQLIGLMIKARYEGLSDPEAETELLNMAEDIKYLASLAFYFVLMDNRNNPIIADINYQLKIRAEIDEVVSKQGLNAVEFKF